MSEFRMWRTTKGLAGYNVARPRQLDVNQRPETIEGLIGLGGRQLREIGRRLDVKSDLSRRSFLRGSALTTAGATMVNAASTFLPG